MTRRHVLVAGSLLLGMLAADPAPADEVAPEASSHRVVLALEEPPEYGVFYERYEPTFYTGFAPRTLEPQRIHLHLGRGNQLRATVVLSEEVLAGYARDLQTRKRTYRTLVDRKRIVPTQNAGLDTFEGALEGVDLDGLVAQEPDLSAEDLRQRNLELMERLNPGRVFRIEIAEDDLVQNWLDRLRPEDRQGLKRERKLELLNALLPTRLWEAEIDGPRSATLQALVKSAPEGTEATPAFRSDFFRLFDAVTEGRYPRRAGQIRFVEFTAVYPVGSFNEYTDYRGRKIPLYPTPGRRALTTHQRTHTVDHIPTKVSYSYSPWIPYMHVGTTLHNSFHTLWWPMEAAQTDFLPETWLEDGRAHNGEKPYRYLWLLSRGPMSSGCTHVNTGHIAELRHLLPSETAKLYEIDVFLNRSYDFDVFDVDGDLNPEVMGVRYFIAYSLRNKRPNRLRVRNERRAYYDWLYGGELQYDEEGNGLFRDVRDGHFVERSAIRGSVYPEIPLYEAAYEPEKVQFYRLVDIEFARELRKVALGHTFPGLAPGD